MIYHDTEGCYLRNGLTVIHWLNDSGREDYVFSVKLKLWVTYDIRFGWRAGNKRLFFKAYSRSLEEEHLIRDFYRGRRFGR